MKFVHTVGNIADVDGYTFFFRNVVDVVNPRTIEKLLKNERFKVVEEKFPETKSKNPVPTCKKCGKEFSRGLFMHEKYCGKRG